MEDADFREIDKPLAYLVLVRNDVRSVTSLRL
jgi:hypothetical protein